MSQLLHFPLLTTTEWEKSRQFATIPSQLVCSPEFKFGRSDLYGAYYSRFFHEDRDTWQERFDAASLEEKQSMLLSLYNHRDHIVESLREKYADYRELKARLNYGFIKLQQTPNPARIEREKKAVTQARAERWKKAAGAQ